MHHVVRSPGHNANQIGSCTDTTTNVPIPRDKRRVFRHAAATRLVLGVFRPITARLLAAILGRSSGHAIRPGSDIHYGDGDLRNCTASEIDLSALQRNALRRLLRQSRSGFHDEQALITLKAVQKTRRRDFMASSSIRHRNCLSTRSNRTKLSHRQWNSSSRQ